MEGKTASRTFAFSEPTQLLGQESPIAVIGIYPPISLAQGEGLQFCLLLYLRSSQRSFMYIWREFQSLWSTSVFLNPCCSLCHSICTLAERSKWSHPSRCCTFRASCFPWLSALLHACQLLADSQTLSH